MACFINLDFSLIGSLFYVHFLLLFILEEIDSYMYQSVGHNVLDLYASAMDLPLFRTVIKGKALNQNFDYIPTDGDEVEDLYSLLVKIKVVSHAAYFNLILLFVLSYPNTIFHLMTLLYRLK